MDKGFLTIGRLGAPKGVRGDLKLQSYSGEYAHFRKLKEVELRSPPSDEASQGAAPRALTLKILRIDESSGSPTIAFEGYPSPEKARELTGLEIVAPRSAAAPLKSNEWYIADLVGLSLVAARGSPDEGKVYGRVRSVLEGAADPCLEIVRISGDDAVSGSSEGAAKRRAEGSPLVPFRSQFVGEVDLKAGTIELLAPYLLEE